MDVLVKAAMDRVNEAVTAIHWTSLEEISAKRASRVPAGENLEVSIAKAVHAVDALKAALLSIPNTCL